MLNTLSGALTKTALLFIVLTMLAFPLHNTYAAGESEWEVEFTMDATASGDYEDDFPYDLYWTGSGTAAMTVSSTNQLTGTATAEAQMTVEAVVYGEDCTGDLTYPATFKIKGTYNPTTEQATFELYDSSPATRPFTVDCETDSYTVPFDSPFDTCGNSISITLADGVTEENTFVGEAEDCDLDSNVLFETTVTQLGESQPGEWTGTIVTDLQYTWAEFDGTRTVEITRSAEISFTVPEDPYSFGDVTGQGSGSEEYNLHYVVSDGSGECPESYDQGSTDVTFELAGYVDEDTGEVVLEMRQLTPYQYIVNRGCVGPYDSTGYYVYAFDSWNAGSFEIDLQDGAVYEQNIGAGRDGFDRLTIHGGGSSANDGSGDDGDEGADDGGADEGTDEEQGGNDNDTTEDDNKCNLTITPTMPPASNPRQIASLTDTVTYRMQVAWDGAVPVKVNFNVEGGDETIMPSFVFNPANMLASPISVLMDVDTKHAEQAEYPLSVYAWVVDPDTGEECYSNIANVMLEVSIDSGDVVFTDRTGEVEIMPEEADDGGRNRVIQTGDDGAATFTIKNNATSNATASTTVNVGPNTSMKQYDRIDYVEKILADKAKTAEAFAWDENDLLKYKSPGAWERLKGSIQEFMEKSALTVNSRANTVYSCLFAPLDSNIADICSEQSVIYISEGDVHITDTSSKGKMTERVNEGIPGRFTWDRLVNLLLTRNSVIIPNGTEFTVNVQQDGGSEMTTVTMLEGSAIVVDLVSEEIQWVTAGQKYYMEASYVGGTVSAEDHLENTGLVSFAELPHIVEESLPDMIDIDNVSTGLAISNYITMQSVPDKYAEQTLGITGQFVTTLAYQDRFGREDSNNNLNVFLQISHTEDKINSMRGVQLGGDTVVIIATDGTRSILPNSAEIQIPSTEPNNVPQKSRDILNEELEPKETPQPVLDFLDNNIDFINKSTGDHLTHYILVQTVPDVYAEKVLGITGQFVTTFALQDRYGREDSNDNLNVFLQMSHTADTINSLRGLQLGGDDIEVIVNGVSQGLMTKTVEISIA